jgi:hypothetical protein
MRATFILASVIFLAAQTATAADLKLIPRSKAAVPAANVSIQAYGDHDATCLVWTDGCRNCDRTEKGPSCSNIGIACQPGPIKCTTRKSN